jgi:hypothetical protein
MAKTIAQMDAEWIAHGNIARLQQSLKAEQDEGRRKHLVGLLKEQLELLAKHEV